MPVEIAWLPHGEVDPEDEADHEQDEGDDVSCDGRDLDKWGRPISSSTSASGSSSSGGWFSGLMMPHGQPAGNTAGRPHG
jgi:hypothetical protein